MEILTFLIVFLLCALSFSTGLRTADSYHRELEVEMRRAERCRQLERPLIAPFSMPIRSVKESHHEPDGIGASLTDRVSHGEHAVSFGSIFDDAGRIQ